VKLALLVRWAGAHRLALARSSWLGKRAVKEVEIRKPMRLFVVLAAAFGLALAGSVPALAAVAVSIEPDAKLVANGAIRAVVAASCDPGDQVLEAHMTVSQDNQAIFGQTGLPVRCDGKSRKYRATVTPLEGAFHPGAAFASAFVLTCADPTCGTTEQGQDARTITVR
jgi:hypothetical protein